MKIAVMNPVSSIGAWRLLFSILINIKKTHPDVEFTVYYEKIPNNINMLLKDLQSVNIKTKFIVPSFATMMKNKSKNKFLNSFYNKISCSYKTIRQLIKGAISNSKLNKEINEHDLLFVFWDYNLSSLNLNVPVCYIQHDFIFTHFFGLHCSNAYGLPFYNRTKKFVDSAIEKNATFIAGTNYIANELYRAFPKNKNKVEVIYAKFSNNFKSMSKEKCAEVLKKFDIKSDYIIFPTNDMHHKNMSEVLGGFYYVKQKFPNIKLIITGYNTDGIYVQCNSPYYCDHIDGSEPYDVKSCGLVTNEELVALIQSAKLLVNASLCEAACGSGLDAWEIGTPTAISNILPYVEQVDRLGVKTEFFNPKNSEDIAEKILYLLENPEVAAENVRISKEALLNGYTEEEMANEYVKVFANTIESYKQNNKDS